MRQEISGFLQEHWRQSGFSEPTEIQKQALPIILEGKSLVAESPTGTGKTLAYLLPILTRIDVDNVNVQAVVLASSRELVMQIFEVAQKWTKESKIRVASFIGGVAIDRQLDKLKKKPQLLIGTPGRLDELIQRKKLKMHEVKTIVLDEGDYLLQPEHANTLSRIVKSTMRDRQLLLFSATIPEPVHALVEQWMDAPTLIKIVNSTSRQEKVKHLYFLCDKRDKIVLIEKLTKVSGIRALAFVKDIGNMMVQAEKLTYKHVKVAVLNSDTKKTEREAALKGFRTGSFPLLLATDIAARGLDIVDLEYVLNIDMPKTVEQYIHRAGRTGRHEAHGVVISLVTPAEERDFWRLTKNLGITPEKARLYKGEIIVEN